MDANDDMINKKINRWTVKEFRGINKHSQIQYLCICECGTERLIPKSVLNRIPSKSCGCVRGTHNKTKTREYNSWQSMIRRCVDPNSPNYKYYGGRGIEVCDEWRNSFEKFLEDMGERPEGMTIDRIDVNDNYKPSNCKWEYNQKQQLNKRERKNRSGEPNITMREFKGKIVYKAVLKRFYIERQSYCYEDISKAIEIRDLWLREYDVDVEKWVFNTKNNNYRK